jgi:hypothetical protein
MKGFRLNSVSHCFPLIIVVNAPLVEVLEEISMARRRKTNAPQRLTLGGVGAAILARSC